MPFREVGKACFLVFWRMEKHAFQYFGGWKSMLSSILEDGKACFTIFWRMEKHALQYFGGWKSKLYLVI